MASEAAETTVAWEQAARTDADAAQVFARFESLVEAEAAVEVGLGAKHGASSLSRLR